MLTGAHQSGEETVDQRVDAWAVGHGALNGGAHVTLTLLVVGAQTGQQYQLIGEVVVDVGEQSGVLVALFGVVGGVECDGDGQQSASIQLDVAGGIAVIQCAGG